MIGGLCCCGLSSLGQTSDPTTIDQPNNSWTATTDFQSDELYPSRAPVRIIETHRHNGNRMFEEQSVQIKGTDGHLAPYRDIETETLQLDAATVRTTKRTFGRDLNGAKSLIQITEEEQHILPGGDSTILRITYNADVNGRLQPIERDVMEVKPISQDVEETNTTVMLSDINGGLAPAFKMVERRKQQLDGTTESQKTILAPDGAGRWEVTETRRVISAQKEAKRTAEERVSRRDAEGKLGEISRVVNNESESASGEMRNTVETYSVDVPGTTRDGSLHLVERKTSIDRSSSTGERSTEQQIEQINPGDPGAGLRVSVLVNGKIVPTPSGEQSTVTIRVRDSNGSFGMVSFATTKSDRIPTLQILQVPAELPK